MSACAARVKLPVSTVLTRARYLSNGFSILYLFQSSISLICDIRFSYFTASTIVMQETFGSEKYETQIIRTGYAARPARGQTAAVHAEQHRAAAVQRGGYRRRRQLRQRGRACGRRDEYGDHRPDRHVPIDPRIPAANQKLQCALISAFDPAHQFVIAIFHRLTAFSVSITQKHPQKDEPRRTFFMTAKNPEALHTRLPGNFVFIPTRQAETQSKLFCIDRLIPFGFI